MSSIVEIEQTISIDIEDDISLEIEGYISGHADPYTGSYSVIPRVDKVILPTANKTMANDVTVFQIPYAEVSNPQGGNTVTIGLE